VVLIRILIKTIFFLFLFISSALSSRILDYETEDFLKKIKDLILSVNDYDKPINISIILDQNPNALVNEKEEIIITSGLITESPDYISLLTVLAHEIGHLEKKHIIKRKNSIKNLQSINQLGNLAIIAGSIISQNPDVVTALAMNQVGINNYYLSYSKEQEREADYYAMNTLKKLNLPSKSIIKFLNKLEKNSINKGINEDFQKFTTHPIFKERYEIMMENEIVNSYKKYNQLNIRFNFIKAKFLAYTSEKNIVNKLNNPYKKYYESISSSKKGNLKKSLKKINELIVSNKNNIYLIETKADILLSFGYNKEAVKFYKKVVKVLPHNQYAKIRIFNNINLNNLSNLELNTLFKNNLELLFNFPSNKNIELKYIDLVYILNKIEWIEFFELYQNVDMMKREFYKKEMKIIYNKTDDKYLKKLIKLKS
tara:strand:+ start:30720 stop:31997 length:1278 start_codon:yes stop_codon:yes gene_type:complete